MHTMGQRISELRKKHKYSQVYVAKALNVSRQAVSRWECDLSAPDTYNLIELAKLLEVSVEYITLGDNESWIEPINFKNGSEKLKIYDKWYIKIIIYSVVCLISSFLCFILFPEFFRFSYFYFILPYVLSSIFLAVIVERLSTIRLGKKYILVFFISVLSFIISFGALILFYIANYSSNYLAFIMYGNIGTILFIMFGGCLIQMSIVLLLNFMLRLSWYDRIAIYIFSIPIFYLFSVGINHVVRDICKFPILPFVLLCVTFYALSCWIIWKKRKI